MVAVPLPLFAQQAWDVAVLQQAAASVGATGKLSTADRAMAEKNRRTAVILRGSGRAFKLIRSSTTRRLLGCKCRRSSWQTLIRELLQASGDIGADDGSAMGEVHGSRRRTVELGEEPALVSRPILTNILKSPPMPSPWPILSRRSANPGIP